MKLVNPYLKNNQSLEELKVEWLRAASDPEIICYDPRLIPRKQIKNFDFLLIDENIPSKDYASQKRGQFKFNFNQVKRKQKLFNNVLGNNEFSTLIAPWPRDAFQFLIISNEWQPQAIHQNQQSLFHDILDDQPNLRLYVSLHEKVVNHFHAHLTFKPYYFAKQGTQFWHPLKYLAFQNDSFPKLFKKICKLTNQLNNASFSVHFWKHQQTYYSGLFFKQLDKKPYEIHAQGIVTIQNQTAYKTILSIARLNASK